MSKEDEIKKLLEKAVNLLEQSAHPFDTACTLVREAEAMMNEPQPDLPDNTLPNAPVLCSEGGDKPFEKRYFSELNEKNMPCTWYMGGTQYSGASINRWGNAIIDRNHGDDNHWLPWDGKDELPPYVKPDDYMTVLLEAPDQDYEYRSCLARDVPWVCVTQYLWLERDS